MPLSKPQFLVAGRWLTFAASAAIVLSIAAFNILLAAALLMLALSGERFRLPRFKWILALFMLGTIIAWIHSGDLATGWPQIKKFWVFAELLIVFSLLRVPSMVRNLFLVWTGFATVTALVGFAQFSGKILEARRLGIGGHDFYDYYVGKRITGLTNHWNTFSAEEMFAIIMLASFLFFAVKMKRQWIWVACAVLISLAVLLIETRGIYIALAVALVYLVACWKPKLLLALPVIAALGFFAMPSALRERFDSVFNPKQVDSNTFRKVVWRTGIQMIEAHPWLGLGPEEQRVHFDEYVPKDIHDRPEGFYGHLHNLYLEYAAERGIPTLLVFLWMIVVILRDFVRGVRAMLPGRSNRRFILHGAIAVVIAALVEGAVEVNLGDTEVLVMFLAVVACGYLALEKDLVFE